MERGENTLIIAPTGAGKTEAAVLPLLRRLASSGHKGISALYITPLRALNRDLIGRLESLCTEVGISVAVRHGDTTQSERRHQAAQAPQLLITTPETLQSILPTKRLGAALANLKAVVIDEVHELYHTKRGAQLSIALERLESISPGFQRIGISATVSDEDTIGRFLCGARHFEVAKSSVQKGLSLRVTLPSRHDSGLGQMAQRFDLDTAALARLGAIADSIAKSRSTLVFANTRQVVEALGSRLVYLNTIRPFGGIGVHHSSLDRSERVAIEGSFKRGELKSIIATSSLELGIDIGRIDLVVQYGSPRQALRLVQRVGRSGHSERGAADGLIVAMNTMDAVESVAICAMTATGVLERFDVQRNALDVLAGQLCGIALDFASRGAECKVIDALATVRASYCYRDLPTEEFSRLLKFMDMQRVVRTNGSVIVPSGRTRMFYYEHLSVIPDTKRFIVRNAIDNKVISSLDERFVSSTIEEGSVFITKGLPWRAISIDEQVVTVEPSSDLGAAVPDWSGEDIPVSNAVAQRVRALMAGASDADNVGVDDETAAVIAGFIEKQKSVWAPTMDSITIERAGDYAAVYTWLGTTANAALSKLITSNITTRLGQSVPVRTSPYIILVELGPNSRIDLRHVLSTLHAQGLERSLMSATEDSELFRYKFVEVAKRFGLIDRDASVSKSMVKRLARLYRGTPIHTETVRELMENAFDIKTLGAFLDGLASGSTAITVVDLPGMSPLTKAITESAYYTRELVLPLTPDSAIIESFASSILSKQMELICTYCGFRFSRKVSDVKDHKRIACPSCGSAMVAAYSERYEKAIAKRAAGLKLTKADTQSLSEALRTASLFDAYGGRAAVALSTYGVGPKSAARALMMLRRDERLFYIDLLDAQRTFIRTKKYWSP